MSVSSADLASGKFGRDLTCDGGDSAPSVSWSAGPKGTIEYAVRLDDEDASGSGGRRFTHWLVYNLPLGTSSLSPLPAESIVGLNDFGKASYGGPCPPKGTTHHYRLTVFALKRRLHVDTAAKWSDIASRLQPLTLASASLNATYSR